jgi:predicted transcriptional regulator
MGENTSLDNLGSIVFKRIVTKDLGKLSLDGQMLSILMELDGEKDMAAISGKLGMTMETVKKSLNSLLKLGIIELSQQRIANVGKEFFQFLNQQFSLAVGPIARILIEDAVQDLGQTINRFPVNVIAELVDLLARQIRREEKGVMFRQNMLKKIKELGL